MPVVFFFFFISLYLMRLLMNIAATKMFFKELLNRSSRQFLTGFEFDVIVHHK